jgi:hypothetical protein
LKEVKGAVGERDGLETGGNTKGTERAKPGGNRNMEERETEGKQEHRKETKGRLGRMIDEDMTIPRACT